MYTLWKILTKRQLLLQQSPSIIGALLIAEIFFKFGSFSLEAVGFLATWFLLDALVQTVLGVHERMKTSAGAPVTGPDQR